MQLRETACHIFLSTLDRLGMTKVMDRHIHCADGILHVGDAQYCLHEFRLIKVVSVGKAAVPMAEALIKTLGLEIASKQTLDGIVVGATAAHNPRLRCFVGGHPLPNEQSFAAGAAVLDYLSGSESDCLVFFLISGGASTMMELPLDSTMTIEDTAAFHQVLVHSGLRIDQMNALRKHFSAVKGGRLAVAAAKATKCTLMVSDVSGDALHIIGSGPTLPDPSTAAECRAILADYSQALPFSEKVIRFFAAATLPETPKEGDAAFLRSASFALLSSYDLCVEARWLGEEEGFQVVVDNRCDEWPYADAAEYLLQRLDTLRNTHSRVCLLSAGEISVKVEGKQGVGGRNQHFVLECARRIAKSGRRVTVLSAGTDGIDGNSLAAGAVADETTLRRAEAKGLDVDAALAHFDSNRLLHAIGDTLVTGPSGNNVRDLRILLSAD